MLRLSSANLLRFAFALQPVVLGCWLPHIPIVQHNLGIGPATLALALLGMPVGTLLALPLAGRIVSALGARRTVLWFYVVFFCLMPLPAFSGSVQSLFISLALAGAAMAVLELGLNVLAVQTEKSSGRLLMSACHGFWSLGLMAGGALGASLAAYGSPVHINVTAAAATVFPFALACALALPADQAVAEQAGPAAGTRNWLGTDLVLISLFAFGVTLSEGAMSDWSAIYLRDVFGAKDGLSGIGFVVFAAMVAAGRLAGDTMRMRLGAVTSARICGAAALAGLALALASPVISLTLAGFAMLGFGVSLGFPIAVTAVAGLGQGNPASNVAVLSFIALLGFLVGPVLIGFVAEHHGIRTGLSVLAPALLLSLALTRHLDR